MAEVEPDADEETEVGACDWGVEVVEDFGCLWKEVWVSNVTLSLSCDLRLTARKKSEISMVMYTAIPM